MGIVVIPTYGADPATVNAANLDAKVSGLATEFNGSIDNDNIKAAAGIVASKLNLATITDNIAHSGTMTHTGIVTMTGKILKLAKGADVASVAGTTTLGDDGNYFDITGTNAITSITAKTAGTVVVLQFDSTASLVDGSNLKLNGNFQGAAESQIMLSSDGTNWFEISRSAVNYSGGIVGSYKNLKVVRNSVTQITVTADELILEDSSNNKATVRSVSEAIAITTAGAGGLDTGSEGASRWYFAYIIRKSSDGTTDGLISESATAPTMPSGYDQKALVSAVYNSSGSDFVNFTQRGNKYFYTVWQSMASGNVGTGSWTSITTSQWVPSALSTYPFGMFSGANVAAITNDSAVATGSTLAPNKYSYPNTGIFAMRWELDIITANTLYWLSDAAGANVYIHGFEINSL